MAPAHPHETLLKELAHRLDHLPPDIPEESNKYGHFIDYVPSPEDVEKFGAPQSALNNDLELAFGRRDKGPVKLLEQGAGLAGVATTLRKYIDGTSKEETLLLLWATDLIAATEEACKESGFVVPPVPKRKKVATEKREAAETAAQEVVAEKKGKAAAKERKKVATEKTAQDVSFNFDDLSDDEFEPYVRGRHQDEFLNKLCRPCHVRHAPDIKRFRCTAPGCHHSCAAPRASGRVLRHAVSECSKISAALRQEAIAASSADSLGAKVKEMNENPTSGHQAGGSSSQKSVEKLAKMEGWSQKNTRLNHNVLKLICAALLPPTLVDYEEWVDMLEDIDSRLECKSSSTFVDSYIPREAALVRKMAVERLRHSRNLTITFDGGTSRKGQSFYTIHVFDPITREAYLLEASAESGVSHTGVHLAGKIEAVIREVGAELFSGVCSDSTGNTLKARELTENLFITIIPFGDGCHHASNTGKDLCALEYWTVTIDKLRSTITFFHHSSFAKQHLTSQRLKMGITHGPISISNTRFMTIFWAAEALFLCLPAIKELIQNDVLDTGKKSGIAWMKNRLAVREFEEKLLQLKTVLEPLARAVKCLESLHSTPADVYLFWLAIMATYSHLFKTNSAHLGLPDDVITSIKAIMNFRFEQMIGTPSKHVYLATFFLDFHYINSPILKRRNMNVLSTNVTLRRPAPQPKSNTAGTQAKLADQDLRDSMPAYSKAGAYLCTILAKEINAKAAPELFDKYDDSDKILEEFRFQFMQYTRQVAPFDRHTPAMTPIDYWTSLLPRPGADILAYIAVKLFSLLPNSMVEERTVSTFTKLNSPDRSQQKPSTLLNMTMIRQHYRRVKGQTTSDARNKPVVRFRDLDEYLKAPPKPTEKAPAKAPVKPKAGMTAATSIELSDDEATGSSTSKTVKSQTTKLPPPKELQSSKSTPLVGASVENGEEVDLPKDLEDHRATDDSWHARPHKGIEMELDSDFKDTVGEADGVDVEAAILRDMLSDTPVAGAEEVGGKAGTKRDGDKGGGAPVPKKPKKIIDVSSVQF